MIVTGGQGHRGLWMDGQNLIVGNQSVESKPGRRKQRATRLYSSPGYDPGNGRTARLIMNLVLLRVGYPPAIIARANRRQYYRVLAQADGDQPEPLVNLVGRAVERSLTLYLEACTPQTAPPALAAEWLPLREAAELTPYSQDYLSLLARTGRLEAVKRGRVWHTTRQALAAYLESVGKAAVD